MSILLTNDDGVEAPGLKALWRAIEGRTTEAIVVVPDRHLSGCSHQAGLPLARWN